MPGRICRLRREWMKETKSTVTGQITKPLTVFLIILIIITMAAMFLFSIQQTFIERRDKGQQIAEYMINEVTDYRSVGWLVDFWLNNRDSMELIYDEPAAKETEAYLESNIPHYTLAKDVTEATVTSLPAEVQMKFAEYCYAEMSAKFNWVKRSFKPTYLDAFIIRNNECIFMVSGCREGETHISEGGGIFELGVTTPFATGTYPVLDKILSDQTTEYNIEISLSAGADHSNIRTFAPVYDESGEMAMLISVSQEWYDILAQTLRVTLAITLIVLVLLVLLDVRIVRLVLKYVVRPIKAEEAVLSEYISDKNADKAMEGLAGIRSGNEIQTLAENFSFMASEIDRYVQEIRTVTAEKERIGAELDMAARIQESQLPSVFPAFPDRGEFDIIASMNPAKEVGGDFYDFFLIDEDHLALVIADVSGKGVPAALFMMASKMLINNYALPGKTPADILSEVNERVCERNADDMFVTVWLGILEISTGRLSCCNAGHEYPAIRKAGGSFELLKDKHGPVVGAMDGVRYRAYEIQLEPGDTVFVYTDGVPEATDAKPELFGNERMVKALNSAPDGSLEELLKGVKRTVDEFVGEAPQFDDLTMLAMRYIGKD